MIFEPFLKPTLVTAVMLPYLHIGPVGATSFR